MTLKTVRLELARSKEFPAGSTHHGYELRVPLTADGHLDAEGYAAHKGDCRVRRFWAGEDDRRGELIRTRNHAWAISYMPGTDDDEAIFKLDRHLFRVNEYITITEPDGDSHTFRVASVS